ncbi:MAG: rod shape-determining protein MreC [Proteobacteria bacterium]|nr:rod shape-determining protein MreC [Pseudomonadota bacterium]
MRVLILMSLSIVLMVLDHQKNYMNTVQRTIGVVVYPIQVVVDAPFRFWHWLRDSTANRHELQLEVSRLKTERLLTNGRLQRFTALEAENARLRALLEARPHDRDEIRVAEIMAVDANRYRHSLVIDIGRRDGVYDGQSIIDADGVVGQVIKTGLATSQAILISDPSHALPVQVSRNGLRTIAIGTGEFDRLDLPFLPNNADIEPGDLLVTSGLGGEFSAGYPVAVVATVNRMPQQPFADVTAIPSSALNQVREVMLIWSATNTTTVDADSEAGEPDD